MGNEKYKGKEVLPIMMGNLNKNKRCQTQGKKTGEIIKFPKNVGEDSSIPSYFESKKSAAEYLMAHTDPAQLRKTLGDVLSAIDSDDLLKILDGKTNSEGDMFEGLYGLMNELERMTPEESNKKNDAGLIRKIAFLDEALKEATQSSAEHSFFYGERDMWETEEAVYSTYFGFVPRDVKSVGKIPFEISIIPILRTRKTDRREIAHEVTERYGRQEGEFNQIVTLGPKTLLWGGIRHRGGLGTEIRNITHYILEQRGLKKNMPEVAERIRVLNSMYSRPLHLG